MKLIAKQAFSWAHRGVQVELFEVGQSIETDDPDLIGVAAAEGWAVREADDDESENEQPDIPAEQLAPVQAGEQPKTPRAPRARK